MSKHKFKVTRSSESGKFVEPEEAVKHPGTTVTEVVKKPKLVKKLDPLDYTKIIWVEE